MGEWTDGCDGFIRPDGLRKASVSVLCVTCYALLSIVTAISAAEEQVPTGVRAIGLGEAFVGLADDENSVRRNPAGLARLDRYAVGFEQTPSKLFDALETSYLSAVLPTSEKLALGIDWLQVGLADEELDATRDSFNFAYSYAPLPPLSLGVNLKYLTWAITLDGRSQGNATGWGTDIGAIVQPNRRWTIGVLAQDFIGFGSGKGLSRGTWMRHDTGVNEQIFPTAYKLGIAYRPVPNCLLAADVTDRLHLGAEFLPNPQLAIRAGFQKDLHTAEPLTYSFGGSVKYKWLSVNLAYLIPPTLPPTAYLGLSLNFDFRKLPVRIEQVRMRDLYPVHYHYYARSNREAETIVLDEPASPPVFTDADRNRYYPLSPSDSIGRVWLKNESNKPVTVRIQVFIDQFVSKNGTEVAPDIVIPPLKRISVPMRQLVLSQAALQLTHRQSVEAQIQVIESGGRARRIATETLVLHGNHTTRLDEVAKLASFITSGDAAIQAFVDQIRTAFQEEIESTEMPPNLYMAMLLFNALNGITYAPDANIPLKSGTIDQIRYPHEMLKRLMGQNSGTDDVYAFGDCDDSTALYCSLLETAGIKTALIQLPNHVLMAFDFGQISLEQAQRMDLPDVFYQSINGRVWIPVETTLIKDGFAAAWQAASRIIRLESVTDAITVEDAWEKYGESVLGGTPFSLSIPRAPIQKRMEADFAHPWVGEFLKAYPAPK